ncbi:MAG: hypothetical protein JNL30_14825 [Rubrivivax sp.]|nr:hypothetical protein [Rubrivivax sp.]
MSFNVWLEVDPDSEGSEDHLSEDLLQLEHADCNLLVDVGWYGSGPNATFGAVVYRGDFHGLLLAHFESRSRRDVVATVERWLQNPWAFRDPPTSTTSEA